MKSLGLVALTALALVAATPALSEAQVRVSVQIAPRHGYVYRTYTPPVYYRSYHVMRPRVEVIRVYRPAPVAVIYRNPHRAHATRVIRHR